MLQNAWYTSSAVQSGTDYRAKVANLLMRWYVTLISIDVPAIWLTDCPTSTCVHLVRLRQVLESGTTDQLVEALQLLRS